VSRFHLLFGIALIFVTAFTQALAEEPAQLQPSSVEAVAPLVIGNRTIHTFRVSLGMFSASERAASARSRIEAAFAKSGEGWTSVKPTEQGLQIELDGQPLFLVLPGDAHSAAGETAENLANQASRVLQKAWAEARERRDPRASLDALLKVSLATVLLLIALTLLVTLLSKARNALIRRFSGWLQSTAGEHLRAHTIALIPSALNRALVLLTWLLGLFLIFMFLTYSLGLFVLTRPASERLSQSIGNLASDALTGFAASLPGMFIAVLIFLLAWIITRIATEFFLSAESRPAEDGRLNAHTAPATRRIVNATLWLFAIAMAYPYLPGSHT